MKETVFVFSNIVIKLNLFVFGLKTGTKVFCRIRTLLYSLRLLAYNLLFDKFINKKSQELPRDLCMISHRYF